MARWKPKKKGDLVIQNRVEITREMLADPDSWPNFPVLPLKRTTVYDHRTKVDCGVILFRSELFGHGITATTVFRMNMYELEVLEDDESIVEHVSTKEFDVFASGEELIEVGWVVD